MEDLYPEYQRTLKSLEESGETVTVALPHWNRESSVSFVDGYVIGTESGRVFRG